MRRLAGGVDLAEYYGVLDGDTADELEELIDKRRESRPETHRRRVDAIAEQFEE